MLPAQATSHWRPFAQSVLALHGSHSPLNLHQMHHSHSFLYGQRLHPVASFHVWPNAAKKVHRMCSHVASCVTYVPELKCMYADSGSEQQCLVLP
jgi:hypothetical protein